MLFMLAIMSLVLVSLEQISYSRLNIKAVRNFERGDPVVETSLGLQKIQTRVARLSTESDWILIEAYLTQRHGVESKTTLVTVRITLPPAASVPERPPSMHTCYLRMCEEDPQVHLSL
jgi:hypothetical protein